MGNGQTQPDPVPDPQTDQKQSDQKDPNELIIADAKTQLEIKEYFHATFPIIISPKIFAIRGEITQIRRYFHANPELKFNEVNTATNVDAYLKDLGISTKTQVAQTGVVGLLKGDHDGPCIMLRADMDALPLEEIKSADNSGYISKNQGIMHACGHDAHMAILCGAAKILSSLKHMLHGSVKFVFQPGEEGGAGAYKMMNDIDNYNVLNEPYVDQVYGLHVWSYDKFGTSRVINGPLMAGCIHFEILVEGKGGHAAIPQNTKDTIVAISHLVQQLHSIVSRNIDPLKNGVITIGKIECGQRFNVIAEKGKLYGTMRWFDDKDYNIMMERVRQICTGIEYSFDVKITFKRTPKFKYPPVINRNKECCDLVKKSVSQVLPQTKISGVIPDVHYKTMISEDFGFFLNERPGCFFLLGAGVDDQKDDKPFAHHKPDFKLDERVLTVGAQIFVTLVLERLVKWTD